MAWHLSEALGLYLLSFLVSIALFILVVDKWAPFVRSRIAKVRARKGWDNEH